MLNSSQQQAVKFTEGPVRIIAGAGTGKTFTLVSRIAFLVNEKKINPEKILALTFTNKAAHELNERLIAQNLPAVHAMTFHSMAANFLRRFWNPDFKIVTDEEKKNILSEIIGYEEIDNIKTITEGLDVIRYKEPLMTENFLRNHPSVTEQRLREILKAFAKVMNEKNAVDFTGLLSTLNQLWSDRPDYLSECRNLFSYVFVDEYQDVNPPQIKIMQNLVYEHQNICVVGDPDQTIYSWRGARAETMTKFERLYSNTTSVSLTKNYRNPPAVLRCSEKLISHNIGRLKKTLQPSVENARPVTLWECENEWREIDSILHILENSIGSLSAMHIADHLDVHMENEFRKFSDIAILVRTQAHGRFICQELIKKGYPCQMSAPDNFWEKKEITDFLEAADNLVKWTDIDKINDKFSKWIDDKINKFIQANNFTKSQSERLNLLIPYSVALDHLPIKEALTRLLDESRTDQEADNVMGSEKINIMTLHAAKGLEFPVVIIPGLEEGNLPYKKSKDDAYWLEEERRLFYVGMTRATDELHILHSKQINSIPRETSRFIKECGLENFVLGSMPEVKIRQIHHREMKKAQMKLF